MRTGISLTLSPTDRDRLADVIRDRNPPQKHVWRAEIVLLSAEGAGTREIMRRTGKSKTCVWRWQERFAAGRRRRAAAGQDPALAHPAAWRGGGRAGGHPDARRPARRDDALDGRHDGAGGRHQRQLGAAHLECARAAAAPLAAVQALQRPEFVAKLRDVVGLYVDPPAHAIVLSSTRRARSRRSTAPSRACR